MGYISDQRAVLVKGEYPFTIEDFRQIAGIMREDAGIAFPDTKATLVYSRLVNRLRILGLETFAEYCKLLTGSQAHERRELLTALTTNYTKFFREQHHFDYLRTVVLPPLLEAARHGRRVRLWSAACSSGQEPYSIALTILRLMPDAARYDVRILASDIDPNMIAQGRMGCYSEADLACMSAEMRKWFDLVECTGETQWKASESLRSLIAFRELNLIGKWPMQRRFDAIFCRNAVIYFEDKTQSKVWERMVSALEPDGTLFIGHSERVSGAAASFLKPDGITTYRLRASEGA